MRSGQFLFILIAAALLLSGCNETFEPKGPYMEKAVVYAILTTLSDTQYVRIYKTYNPSGFNPLDVSSDNAIVGAQVSVSSGSTSYQFHDTTIVRSDKSRYQTDIKAYVAYSFVVGKGKSYSLRAVGQGSEYTTSITVPADATILTNSFVALSYPHLFSDDDFIPLRFVLTSFTQGFVLHMYLDYDLLVGSTWTRVREEIPLGIRNLIDCLHFDSIFPALRRRSPADQEQISYQALNYKTMLKKIWNINGFSSVRMKQVVFELTQLEPNLYNYYNIANGFRDKFSIRDDEPDITNVPDGHGIFGALARQSLIVGISDTTGLSLTCGK